MESDTNQLVARARCGDRAAAAELIELFYERIYAFLRRLAASDADAADLTQRTFSRVWQALPGFAGRSSVSSWMHSIAYHAYPGLAARRASHRATLQRMVGRPHRPRKPCPMRLSRTPTSRPRSMGPWMSLNRTCATRFSFITTRTSPCKRPPTRWASPPAP